MDSKTITSAIAAEMGIPVEQAGKLTEALADSLADIATELDSAAVPGFGTFHSVKHEEYVHTDEESGKRSLMPPAIRIGFQPSVVLRKKIENTSRQ